MRKILTFFILMLVVAYSATSQTVSVTTWKDEAKGAYSIIHDDFGSSVAEGIWQYADTIAGNRGIKFSFGALTSECEIERNINGYSGPYEYAKEVMIKKHGHEIIAHSHTHGCAVGGADWSPCNADGWAQTPDNFAVEILQCTKSIEDGTGHRPRYYIYPYDRFNKAANDKLKEEGYIGSRSGWSSVDPTNEKYHREGYNNNDLNTFFPDKEGFFRTSVVIFGEDDESPNDYKVLNAAVDEAISQNQWANRELHNVSNNKRAWGTVGIEGYRKHIDYVKQKVDNGELWVGTLSEILTYQLQKLKYAPKITETASLTWEVEWESINPKYEVDVANYLENLSYKTPLTLKVDFGGRSGEWSITQNGQEVSYKRKNKIFYLDVYPHQGTVNIELKNETFPAPVPENPILDAKLSVEFDPFTIDLNHVFEDANTLDEKLVYAVMGNKNITVNLDDQGIATLSSKLDWEGQDTVIFSAKDEAGMIGYDTVVYDVTGRNTPYKGSPIAIPAKIEAEDFDLGGAGISYLEKDNNKNTVYREGDVDIKNNEGVIVVMDNDEWLEYTIEVDTTGYYDINLFANSYAENTSITLFLDKDNLEEFALQNSVKLESHKLYNIELKEGKHILRVLTKGKYDVDYIEITTPGENTLPKVVTNITDQKLPVSFASFTLDLNEVFEDLETKDEQLTYSNSGNTNISISVEKGIAMIESTEDWEGEEIIIFSAKDFSGGIANDTVKFIVSSAFALPNQSVNNKEGYIFTFDQSKKLNCPDATVGFFGQGYKLESVGGGNLVVSSDGTQFGFHNIAVGLNDQCENTQIDLSNPDKRILEVRIHSTVDVPQFLLALGDTSRIIADRDIQFFPLKANEWQTLTFKFNALTRWADTLVMDATLIDFVTLQFRKSWHGKPQEIAGTFTIDYIKIGGAINPCPDFQVNESIDPIIGVDMGNDVLLDVNIEGGIETHYKWFKNDTLISDGDLYSGTNTSKLIIKDFVEYDAGNYYVQITDSLCNVFEQKSLGKQLVRGDLNEPFEGKPINLPGKIEVENYDLGGQGVSYLDIEIPDQEYGNDYRKDDLVDVLKLDDGGYLVVTTRPGEWLEYTVNVVDSGQYTLDVLAYSWNDKRPIILSLDGDSLTSVLISDADNGIYKNYQEKVFLPKGEHVLRVKLDGYFSIDYIGVRKGTKPTVTEVDDIELKQGFESYKIDLNNMFDDQETEDSKLIYSGVGSEGLTINIVDGIATITASDTLLGTQYLIFYAQDEDTISVGVNVEINIKKEVSTIDTVEKSRLSVYPNPVTSILYIVSTDIDSEIQLIDTRGVEIAKYNGVHSIDVSRLASGVYIIKQGNYRAIFVKK